MLRKIICSTFVLTATLCVAYATIDVAKSQDAKPEMPAPNFPQPDGGVILKPASQLPHYDMLKQSIDASNASIQKYGYIRRADPATQSLLNFTKGNKHFSPKNLTATADSGLYRSINDIQMAYRYYGVPQALMTTELAVAPAGTYLQGQGWTGAAQTFEKVGIGTCNYNELNAKLNHSSVFVPQETATHEINGKVTQRYVVGQENDGFVYNVNWYDDNAYHQLECARADYSAETAKSVLQLAIGIDKNSH